MTASPKKIVILKYGMALVPSQTYDISESATDKDSVIVHLSKYESVQVKKDTLNFN